MHKIILNNMHMFFTEFNLLITCKDNLCSAGMTSFYKIMYKKILKNVHMFFTELHLLVTYRDNLSCAGTFILLIVHKKSLNNVHIFVRVLHSSYMQCPPFEVELNPSKDCQNSKCYEMSFAIEVSKFRFISLKRLNHSKNL